MWSPLCATSCRCWKRLCATGRGRPQALGTRTGGGPWAGTFCRFTARSRGPADGPVRAAPQGGGQFRAVARSPKRRAGGTAPDAANCAAVVRGRPGHALPGHGQRARAGSACPVRRRIAPLALPGLQPPFGTQRGRHFDRQDFRRLLLTQHGAGPFSRTPAGFARSYQHGHLETDRT